MRPPQSTQVDPPYRSIGQLLQEQEQDSAGSSSLQLVSLSSSPPDESSSQPQTQDDFTPAQTFLQQRFATDNGDLFATKPPSPITSNLPQPTTKNLLNPQTLTGGGGSGRKSTPNAGRGGGGPGIVNANQFIGDNFGATNGAPTANGTPAHNVPPSTPPTHPGDAGGNPTPSAPLTDFQTTYSVTPQRSCLQSSESASAPDGNESSR